MHMLSFTYRTSLAVLLSLLVATLPLAAAELEEEVINPSEVIFRDGQPYYDDGGDYVRLRTRREGGELVYFRTVRFDREQGYVDAQGQSIATLQTRPSGRDGSSAFAVDWYSDDRYGGYAGYRGAYPRYGAGLRLGASRNRPYGQIYYGNGLYGPDPYSSPHNRDARQRYIGPGYVGSCDLTGCREVHHIGFYDLR
ncbi:hypothetical protein [Xanthomonas hortorum]|uniref:hypothetical protein n=1 Tax=Xanthomonas hortorum TaxID=56454 RepID=UPI002043D928|nr:hypothetical protein [Xanthomonas hortorum]MCM5525830.1 hypothetical protein [Xanthomonas hortorum pv. pelargonii]MCM5538175.1 hypothetical protein [Xanthomonas hortorum pv. pelargonii]MCM5542361.1 hypothetical protein [Xanthomonas hortorum pv. pelargonii]MCM5545956.1 hypothetical protein [Xanthomonas hortorum pv. pelargonii]MCM5550956.1 hypothetical protein [Xanthomonas hortorum pv. pelargonii]